MTGRRPSRWSRERRPRIPIALLPQPGQDVVVKPQPIYAGRRPGRPSLVAEEPLQRFLTALRAGNYRHVSAIYAGLSYQSVKNWMARGEGRLKDRPPTPEHTRFARMVVEAEAAATVLVTSNLVARSRADTAAALAWLRTRHPDDWPSVPLASEGALDGTLLIDNRDQRQQVVVLDASEYPDLVAKILAQRREEREAAAPPVVVIPEEVPRGSRHTRLNSLRVETDDRAT